MVANETLQSGVSGGDLLVEYGWSISVEYKALQAHRTGPSSQAFLRGIAMPGPPGITHSGLWHIESPFARKGANP